MADLECISILINLHAIFFSNIMYRFVHFRHKQVKEEFNLEVRDGLTHIGISDFLREITERNRRTNTKAKRTYKEFKAIEVETIRRK
jgi:hypothetical protein